MDINNNFLKLERALGREIGDIVKEIPEAWDGVSGPEREKFFKRLYMEFHEARIAMQGLINEGVGGPAELARLEFIKLPKILQIYVKLAFDTRLQNFAHKNISGRLEKEKLPLNY